MDFPLEPLSKGTVAFFRKMDTIKCQLDIPFSGIRKGNTQSPGQCLICLC